MKQTMGEEEAGNRKHASVDLLFLKIASNFFIPLAMSSGVHTPLLKKWLGLWLLQPTDYNRSDIMELPRPLSFHLAPLGYLL